MTMDHQSVWTPQAKVLAVVILALWFAFIYWMGVGGHWVAVEGARFRPVILGLTGPLILFALAYATHEGFRAFVRGQDVEIMTAMQMFRVLGGSFVFLWWFDILPGIFARIAGWGDVLVGVLALAVLIALKRDASFVGSRRFLYFNILGLLDFVGAFLTAQLGSGNFPDIYAGAITTAPLQVWPLSLIITFLVPIFIMAHIAALIAWKRS